ncbi:MAG TPA: hypothetical protein VG650_13155 [Mycobacteriales bacterium]|nr:hypothetical protein [Mycobacteriales bacterium]
MSATSAVVRKPLPVRAGSRPRSRPRLVIVPAGRVVSRTPFVVLVGALLLAGLISLLMLHTLAAQDSFRQTSLQQRLANLTDTEQRLEQQVQLDSAPAALRARAKALGMVPSVITGYHQRANGRIVAHEVAATGVSTTATTTTAAPTTTTTTNTAAKTKTATTTATTTPTTAKQPAATAGGGLTAKHHHRTSTR